MNVLRFRENCKTLFKNVFLYLMMVLKRIPCNTFVRESGEYIYTYYAFKENAFILHHKIVIFHGFLLLFCLFWFFFVIFNLCYLFWQTGSKMVSCSLQFDESSDDDLEKLMTPSSKRKLDLSHVSHMSHMSIASPMQEYVSPCFQVRQQQLMSLLDTQRSEKKNHTPKNISKETIG